MFLDESAFYATLVIGFVLYVCYYRWVLYGDRKGPLLWPVIGNLLESSANFERAYDWILDYHKKFGVFSFYIPGVNYVTVTPYPEDLEYILKTRPDNFVKGDEQQILMRELLGGGIFTADGEKWKSQRKVASLEFTSRVLREYSTEAFKEDALKLLVILDRAEQEKKPVEMQNLFMRMTFESICRVEFGMSVGMLHPSLPAVPFADNFDMASFATSMRFWDPFWRVTRFLGVGREGQLTSSIKVLDNFIQKIIKTRKAETKAMDHEGKPDLLSRFIKLMHEKPLSDNGDKYLRDMILNFMLAGRDTTAATLAWFIYELSQHPDVEEKLLNEIRTVEDATKNEIEPTNGGIHVHDLADSAGRFAAVFNFDNLRKMEYLQAVLSEVMRLHPAVPMNSKTAVVNDVLPSGAKVQAGFRVAFAPYAMGRLETLWGADAAEFNPERFLKDGVFQPQDPFKFVVFNGGPRTCLGKNLAYLQMKMTAVILLRFFSFQIVPGSQVKYRVNLILQMQPPGLPLTLRRRYP